MLQYKMVIFSGKKNCDILVHVRSTSVRRNLLLLNRFPTRTRFAFLGFFFRLFVFDNFLNEKTFSLLHRFRTAGNFEEILISLHFQLFCRFALIAFVSFFLFYFGFFNVENFPIFRRLILNVTSRIRNFLIRAIFEKYILRLLFEKKMKIPNTKIVQLVAKNLPLLND